MIYIVATYRQDYMEACRNLCLNPMDISKVRHISRPDEVFGLRLRKSDVIVKRFIEDVRLLKEIAWVEFKRDNKC